jgi:hypothetical protein
MSYSEDERLIAIAEATLGGLRRDLLGDDAEHSDPAVDPCYYFADPPESTAVHATRR